MKLSLKCINYGYRTYTPGTYTPWTDAPWADKASRELWSWKKEIVIYFVVIGIFPNPSIYLFHPWPLDNYVENTKQNEMNVPQFANKEHYRFFHRSFFLYLSTTCHDRQEGYLLKLTYDMLTTPPPPTNALIIYTLSSCGDLNLSDREHIWQLHCSCITDKIYSYKKNVFKVQYITWTK